MGLLNKGKAVDLALNSGHPPRAMNARRQWGTGQGKSAGKSKRGTWGLGDVRRSSRSLQQKKKRGMVIMEIVKRISEAGQSGGFDWETKRTASEVGCQQHLVQGKLLSVPENTQKGKKIPPSGTGWFKGNGGGESLKGAGGKGWWGLISGRAPAKAGGGGGILRANHLWGKWEWTLVGGITKKKKIIHQKTEKHFWVNEKIAQASRSELQKQTKRRTGRTTQARGLTARLNKLRHLLVRDKATGRGGCRYVS